MPKPPPPPMFFLRRLSLLITRIAFLALCLAVLPAGARGGVNAPASGPAEVAFSPRGGAQELVVRVIDSARSQVCMLAYSFTSAPVTQALLRAERRGVSVALVVDARNNLSEERSGKARAALSALAVAGVDVRTVSSFAIHHDKVIVVDGKTVQTGSFNYSAAAESANSENVLVLWDSPRLAEAYLDHFQRNQQRATRFALPF